LALPFNDSLCTLDLSFSFSGAAEAIFVAFWVCLGLGLNLVRRRR
jgi:hypothetical protein